MSNSIVSYERFDRDGIELVINTATGESFATQAGYARMSGKDPSTISRRYQGVAQSEQKTAEILTPGGLQGVALIPGKIATKWLAKDNPELLAAMSEVGWNVYCHKLAGYQVTSTAVSVPQSYAQALLEAGRLALELEKAEAEKALLEEQNSLLAEAVDELFDYSSIIRIAKFNEVSETRFRWQTLKAMSRKMGYEIKKVPCPRFEWKNLYSHDVWRVCYPWANLPETTTLTIASSSSIA